MQFGEVGVEAVRDRMSARCTGKWFVKPHVATFS